MASKRSRAPATGFGLFAAPVAAPTAQQPNRNGAVEAELAAWIRDKRYQSMARALERGDDPVQPNSNGVPPAANLSEAVGAATSIAGLHKGAAETAMAERQAAEQRAERIAASAGEQIERAKTETTNQWAAVMAMQQEHSKAMTELTMASLKGQIEERDRLRELEMKRIEDKIEALQQHHTIQLTQRDAEIAKLKVEKEQLLTRPTLDDVILDEIREGRRDGLVAHLLGVTRQTDPSTDPDHIFRSGIAQVKVDEAREAVDERRLDKQLKRERHDAAMGLYRNVGDLLAHGRAVVENMVGQPRGLERNGIPPSFDDDEGGGEELPAAATVPLDPTPPQPYYPAESEDGDDYVEV